MFTVPNSDSPSNKPSSRTLHLMLDGVHCGGCVAKIERTLQPLNGVEKARVNLTLRRMVLEFDPRRVKEAKLLQTIESLGYTPRPYDPAMFEQADAKQEDFLLLCLAIAGFASMNVMLISVAMWAGHDSMSLATRTLLQAFSSLITLPAVAYAGQPFFSSAWKALKHGGVNMDVPISLAVILTTALSTVDMFLRSGETYFESAAMLLFFLLCGRYLDQRARGQSRSSAEQLLTLQAVNARRLSKGGKVEEVAAASLKSGDMILVARGERLPADGIVVNGESSIDASLLTGESLPRAVRIGDSVHAGCINTEAALTVRVTASGQATTLAHIAKLVDEATQAKNAYTRIADRLARRYAPVVHTLALVTFSVWYIGGYADFHTALLHAATVLIVTCPCALALAVPAVQVALVTRLLKLGILLKSADALERLNDIGAVIFDKTGTLTTGELAWVSGGSLAERKLAARMGMASSHPLARAMVRAFKDETPLKGVKEIAGKGLEAHVNGEVIRLGSAAFCGAKFTEISAGRTALWLKVARKPAVRFELADTLRDDARETVGDFTRMHLKTLLLSGDSKATVKDVAGKVGLQDWQGEVSPAAKHAALKALELKGFKALMCGDGINDAPSLAAAHIGLTFGNAADIAKTGADIIVQNGRLHDAVVVWKIAKLGHKAVIANFMISFAYNVVTVPIAMAGMMTPLWAAVAMSASSLMVVGNALRLARGGRKVQAI